MALDDLIRQWQEELEGREAAPAAGPTTLAERLKKGFSKFVTEPVQERYRSGMEAVGTGGAQGFLGPSESGPARAANTAMGLLELFGVPTAPFGKMAGAGAAAVARAGGGSEAAQRIAEFTGGIGGEFMGGGLLLRGAQATARGLAAGARGLKAQRAFGRAERLGEAERAPFSGAGTMPSQEAVAVQRSILGDAQLAAIAQGFRATGNSAGLRVIEATGDDFLKAVRSGAVQPDETILIIDNLVRDVAEGRILIEELPRIRQQYNLTPPEVAQVLRDASRFSARFMNQLSLVRKRLNTIFADMPEVAQEAFDLAPPMTAGKWLAAKAVRFNDIRRGMLVTQMATSMRNNISQAFRSGINAYEDALEGGINFVNQVAHGMPVREAAGSAFLDLRESAGALGRSLSRPFTAPFGAGRSMALDTPSEALSGGLQALGVGKHLENDFIASTAIGKWMNSLSRAKQDEALAILDKVPLARERLLSNPLSDLVLGNKVTRLFNTLNVAQERFWRKTAFSGRFRANLQKSGVDVRNISTDDIALLYQRGLDPADRAAAVARTGISRRTLDAAMEDAIDHSLEMTFAMGGREFRNQVRAFQGLDQFIGKIADIGGLPVAGPIITATINPFPRFYANAVRFLMDYSPFGFTRAFFTPKQANALSRGAPELVARAAIGTQMLTIAGVIRESAGSRFWAVAGELPTEIRTGGQEEGVRWDVRSFEPLSAYLPIWQMLFHPDEILRKGQTEDVVRLMAGIDRLGGQTILPLLDAVRSARDPETIVRAFEKIAGEYVSGILTPGRTVRDFITGEEATQRTQQLAPFMGPSMGNLPGVSQELPPFRSPIRGSAYPGDFVIKLLNIPGIGEVKLPANMARQLIGSATRKITPVEQEVNRLFGAHGFRRFAGSSTGNREADLILTGITGIFAEAVLEAELSSPGYKMLGDNLRKFYLVSTVEKVRDAARDAVRAARPDLLLPEDIERRLGPELTEAVGGSKALRQLGAGIREGMGTPGITPSSPLFQARENPLAPRR